MRYSFSLLFLFLPVLASAQERPPTEDRSLRFFFVDRSPAAPREGFLFDGRESEKVSFPSSNFSEVIKVSSGPLTIRLTDEEIIDPEKIPEAAPSLTLPEQSSDLYILVTNDPENPVLPIRLTAISIGKRVSPGETLWINLTDMKIFAELGNEKVEIPPKKQKICGPPLDSSGYYPAKFQYQLNQTGRLFPIIHKHWWFDRTSRNLGFIIDQGGRLPIIFSIRDRRVEADETSGS